MKIEITLPSKPGMLYFLPGLDLLTLVLMFPLLGVAFVRQSGMEVKLFESPWRYQQMNHPIVITLGLGENHPVWMNKKPIKIKDLEKEINHYIHSEEGREVTTVVIKSDVGVLSGFEKEVIIRIQKMGLNCALIGRAKREK